ncbi:MAG: ABC transporter substrate-binding protein [Lachnospiraceae bacterium]|nr:ABC transporter substrate-binding protein [Lachnospiraceae bacterium]
MRNIDQSTKAQRDLDRKSMRQKNQRSHHAFHRLLALFLTMLLTFSALFFPSSRAEAKEEKKKTDSKKTITLRVCNWEEYMDEGDWDESEAIDLPSGKIIGKNSMIRDFEDWYEKNYGVKVKVEYSTFGTNEDLYNMLTLGDSYDLICPSEYMFMKLISENKLVPLSKNFFDRENPLNYYTNGVSPYISKIFQSHKIQGKSWSSYAAGFMWGITGIVYNPNLVTEKEASTWSILLNPKFKNRVTIKDSVRECYFAAVGALEHKKLLDPDFTGASDYKEKLEDVMNDTSPSMIKRVQDWLQTMKDNVYSFEVDAGKADMITGKVAANYQWSGDAVYTMDQADEDDFRLDFAVPEESTNIYFDGWCMLKSGIGHDRDKQQAAEAFINFVSRPDNAIRNMYYIGYTSCISGGSDPRILEYLKWKYGPKAEEKPADNSEMAEDLTKDSEDPLTSYDLSYFFTGDETKEDPSYVLTVPKESVKRQLGAQYPSKEVIRRSSIMRYFNPKQSKDINKMWVNVRCYNILHMPVWGWALLILSLVAAAVLVVRKFHGAPHAGKQ